MLGKRFSRLVSLFTALSISLSMSILGVSANSQTKETPYGTMRAFANVDWDNNGHGPEFHSSQSTSIDSSVTMRKISTSVEVQYADTGETIISHVFEEENTNETPTYHWDFSFDDPFRGAVLYSAHQVLYTNAYIIYLETPAPEWHS